MLGDRDPEAHTVTVVDSEVESVADAVRLRVKSPERESDPEVHALGD